MQLRDEWIGGGNFTIAQYICCMTWWHKMAVGVWNQGGAAMRRHGKSEVLITVGARGSCGQARAFLCEQAELTKCLEHFVNKKINKTIFVSVCVLSPGVHLDHIIIFVATFFHVHKNYYAQADRWLRACSYTHLCCLIQNLLLKSTHAATLYIYMCCCCVYLCYATNTFCRFMDIKVISIHAVMKWDYVGEPRRL